MIRGRAAGLPIPGAAEANLGRSRFFLSIVINSSLWTLIAAACIGAFAYPEDPEGMKRWSLAWLSSLPFLIGFSGLATLSHPAYLDADSEFLRLLLYVSMVLTVGFASPFGWAIFTRLLGLSGGG